MSPWAEIVLWVGVAFAGTVALTGVPPTVGSYLGAKGPRERRFVVRAAAAGTALMAAFCGLLVLALYAVVERPGTWGPVARGAFVGVWACYLPGLPLAIRWANRRHARVRAEEAAGA